MKAAFYSLVFFVAISAAAADNPYRDFTRTRLPNGLEVWIMPRASSRSVLVRVVTKVGFRYEDVRESGISHLLEHLMFKGTRQHDEVTLNRIVESKGAYSNGETWPEATFYEVSIIDRHFPLALAWLHEILTESTLTPRAIEQSRRDVYSEQQGHYPRILERIFESGLFQPLEVRIPEVIYPSARIADRVTEDLDDVDRARLLRHWRQFYVPNNMAVIVVGNVDPDSALQQISSMFGSAAPAAVTAPSFVRLPGAKLPSGEVRTSFFPPAGQMTDVWNLVLTGGARDRDHNVLRIIATYLDRRAFEEVRMKRALSYSVGCSTEELSDTGALWLHARTPRAGDDEEKVKSLFASLLKDLRQNGISASDLVEAKETITGRRVRYFESNTSLAALYQDFYLNVPFGQPVPDGFEAIDRVTQADVARVVRERMSPDRVIVAVARPTLSYGETIAVAAAVVLFIAALVLTAVRRRRNSRASTA